LVLTDLKMLDDALEKVSHGLNQQDKNWLWEVASGTLRHYHQIAFVISQCAEKKPKGRVYKTLAVGIYQLLFQSESSESSDLGRVAKIINETVEFAKKTDGPQTAAFVNALLRKCSTQQQAWNDAFCIVRESVVSPQFLKDTPTMQAALAGVQEWFWLALVRDYGVEWAARYVSASLVRPEFWVRGRTGGRKIQAWSEVGAQEIVQDISSQRVVEWMTQKLQKSTLPSGSKKIIELCAAPGGKTCSLLWLGWTVTATDLSVERLELLKQNADRCLNAEERSRLSVVALDEVHQSKQQEVVIYLDAPCSGVGTIRRHPEILHLKTQQQVDDLVRIQKNLIRLASDLLQPGSELVYSVCSVLKAEGSQHFSPEFLNSIRCEIIDQRIDAPHLSESSPGDSTGGDGFFAIILRKIA
jgi:16S rRNA (cytosine967-C5)-methyltransferase